MNEFSKHDMETETRLARIEGKVDALVGRIDDIVITQLRDHGKRIQALESRMLWAAGWMAGAGAVGAAVVKFML